jgi:hypothetical protein
VKVVVVLIALVCGSCGGDDVKPRQQDTPSASTAARGKLPVYAGDPAAKRKPVGQDFLGKLARASGPEGQVRLPRIRGSAGKALADWLSIVDNDVATFWQGRLNRIGLNFTPYSQSIFRGTANTGCGRRSQESGPAYCSRDATIYLPLVWFARTTKNIGDAATAVVVAHENGHRLQDVMGVLDDSSLRSIDIELQADCLAGYWAASVYRRGLLEPGDLKEAFTITLDSGDAPGTPVDDPSAHGSARQRLAAFRQGYANGAAGDCQI